MKEFHNKYVITPIDKASYLAFLYQRFFALIFINPFHAIVPFLYPLKTLENQRFSNVYRGYRNKGLINK